MQEKVLQAFPSEVSSLEDAREPGGALAGWGLSHGYVVLATAGAILLDHMKSKYPLPRLLLYAPSRSGATASWLDFDGPDDPYHLVGWAYTAPYTPGSRPPRRECIAPEEWFIHEAGWHLKNGGMQLTADAIREPPRPPELDIHMWHPRVWDIHVWRAAHGPSRVTFANPNAHGGGRELPDAAFFRLVDGRKQPVTGEGR